MPITPKQQELIRAKGLDPAVLEKTMGQEKIDKYFPDASKAIGAAKSTEAAKPIVKPSVKPLPRDPTAGIDRAVIVEPSKQLDLPTIQADVTSPKPIIKVPSTNVPSTIGLEDLSRQMVVSRSTTPEGLIDPEKEKAAQEKANRIMGQPFTLGGTPSPVTAPFASQPSKVGFLESLKPQTIQTPEQAYQQSEMDRLTTMDAISQLEGEYREALTSFNKSGSSELAAATEKKLKDLMAPGNPLLKGDVVKRKNYLLEYNALRQEAIASGKAPPAFNPPMESGDITDVAGQVTSDLLKRVMTEPGVGGKIVESAPAYALRMLSAPVSGIVGAVEGAVTDKPMAETIPERIVGGAGIMGAGIDIGSSIADSMGYTEEAAKTDNQIAGKRSAIMAVTGVMGLAGDFMVPVAPGSGLVRAAGKAGAEAYQVEKVLGAATGTALKGAAKQAGKAVVGEARVVPVVGKYIPYEYGKDALSKGISNYATNARNQQTMSDILKIGDELKSNGELKNWDKLDYNDKTKALEAAYTKVGGSDYKAFEAESGKIGDIYNKDLYRDIESTSQMMVRRTVMDNVLTPESKDILGKSGALDSNRLMNDLIEFVQKNGGDTSSLKTVPGLFEKASDIVTRSKTPSTATMIAVLDKDQLAALSKQYLQDIAVKNLTKTAMTSPAKMSLLPNYSRLTRTSFLPDSETKKVINFLNKSAIGKTKDAAAKAIADGKKAIVVEGDLVSELNRTLGSPVFQKEVGEGGAAIDRSIVNDINRLLIKDSSGRYIIQASDWNNLVEKVTDAYAQTLPGYKSIFDVDQELKRVKPVRKEGEIPVPSTSEVIVKEQYYSKVLTPKEVAGGTMENVLVAATSKAIEGSKAASYSELSTEFVDAIGQRFGSIPEDFKMVLKNNRASGLSPQDAWATTVVDNYNRHAEDIIDRIVIESGEAGGVLPKEALDIKQANVEQMFDDYTAMLYGGYESIIEAINTTGRSQYLDGMLIAPFEMRQLAFVLNQNEMVKNIRQEFIKLAMDGKNGEALVKLRDVHAVLQGRPMKQFISSSQQLEEFHKAAVLDDKYGILKKGTGDTFKTDEAFQGKRGIFEMWNYGGETAPMFFVDSHLDLLSAQYMTRRQSAIVSEVYQDWTNIYPELFPSTTTIDRNVERYMGFLENTPLAGKDFYTKILGDLKADIELTYLKQPEIPKPVAPPKDLPQGVTYMGPLEPVKTEAEILAQFEKDKLQVAKFLESEYYPDFAKQIMQIVSRDPALGREVYVGLVEDSLTRLSASEQVSGRYSAAIRKRQAAISNNMMLDIEEQTKQIRDDVKFVLDDYKQQKGDYDKKAKAYIDGLKKQAESVNSSVDPKIKDITEKIKAIEKKSEKYPPFDMTNLSTGKLEKVPADIKQLRLDLKKLKADKQALLAQRNSANASVTIAIEEASTELSNLRDMKNVVVENLNSKIVNKKLQKEIIGKTINALFFSPEAYNYHRLASGAEDYVRSLYPQLRAETTPLFYDTLKTSIRNAATNNLAVLTKGPLEQTQTISLISQDTAAIKGALRRRGGIDEFTKSMEELKIDSNVRKLPPGIEMSQDLSTAIEEGLKVTDNLRDVAVKNKGTANRLGSVLTDVFGSKEAFFADGRVSAYAKGGVLGGQFLPNLRYMMANYLTAPAIIYSTIGGKYAAGSLKTMAGFDFATNQTMKALLGMDLTGGSARISAASAMDIRLAGGAPAEVIVVTTPSGKVYTNYDVAKLVADGGVARSQASAELTTKVIEELTSYAAVNHKKLMSSELKGLNNMSENALKQWIIESYGFPFAKTALTGEVAKEGFPLVSGKRSMNIFSEFANNCDTMQRVSVLQSALKTGMAEEQALKLARESLFDYGNLTAIEKGFFARVFWFWTFRRNSYRAVLKSILTNPERLKNTALANGFIAEMDRDNNIATADYAATRPFIHMIDDPENKQRFALYGPGIPALSAMSELVDYMSVVPYLLNPNISVGEKISTGLKEVPLAYAKQAPPAIQTTIGVAFGVDPRRDAKELGYYLDPKLMWWLQQDPEKWATFQSFINIETVPPDQEVPGRGSYQGRQWRIRKGDEASLRNWFAFQQLMLFGGALRNLQDYSVVGNLLTGEQTSDTQDIRLGGESSNAELIMIMTSSGVVTPIEAVTVQDRIEFNKRAIAEQFKKNTYDTKR